MLPIAVLSGGLATRMRPLTERVPKGLLDVAGEPFAAHQLRLLRGAGFERVVMCIGHLGEMIEREIGDGSRFDLHVAYSADGPRALGTAGALAHARPLLGDAFFVTYGDSYLPCDYHAVQTAFQTSRAPALMTVYRNEGRWDGSNVEFADGRIVAYDKYHRTPAMQYIDFGLAVVRDDVLDLVPAGEPYDLAALFSDLLRRGELAAFEVATRFYEIGSPEGLAELTALLEQDRGGSASRVE